MKCNFTKKQFCGMVCCTPYGSPYAAKELNTVMEHAQEWAWENGFRGMFREDLLRPHGRREPSCTDVLVSYFDFAEKQESPLVIEWAAE